MLNMEEDSTDSHSDVGLSSFSISKNLNSPFFSNMDFR